jgi:hypothetical protein
MSQSSYLASESDSLHQLELISPSLCSQKKFPCSEAHKDPLIQPHDKFSDKFPQPGVNKPKYSKPFETTWTSHHIDISVPAEKESAFIYLIILINYLAEESVSVATESRKLQFVPNSIGRVPPASHDITIH